MLGAGLDFRLSLKLIASCGLEVIPLVSEPIATLSRDSTRVGTFVDKARKCTKVCFQKSSTTLVEVRWKFSDEAL